MIAEWIVEKTDSLVKDMYLNWDSKKWLIGLLFDRNDVLAEDNKAFFAFAEVNFFHAITPFVKYNTQGRKSATMRRKNGFSCHGERVAV